MNSAPKKQLRISTGVSVFFILMALTLVLQFNSGAYQSEFGGHADEASHVLGGMMLRDYLFHGIGQSPVDFAKSYYEHYPKIAIGHYPPGFYLIEGAFMTLIPPGRSSVLWFMAIQSAVFSWLVFLLVAAITRKPAAIAAGLLCAALPLTQRYTSIVMSDILLVIFCLLATAAFCRFLERPGFRWSLIFGCLAALACLVKGSGLLLALVPPAMILLTGKFHVLKTAALWIAPVPVLLVVVPWIALTYHITARGMVDLSFAEYIAISLPYYIGGMFRVFGIWLLFTAVSGAVVLVLRTWKSRVALDARSASFLALPAATVLFYGVVPSGMDDRYLLPLVAGVIGLGAVAANVLAGFFHQHWNIRNDLAGALAALIWFGLFGATHFYVPPKLFIGFGEVVRQIQQSDSPGHVLIVSDSTGEGAFIAELALSEVRPGTLTHRSSKLLAESDWLGRDYKIRIESRDELSQLLSEAGVQWIVIDSTIPEGRMAAHHELMFKFMEVPENFVVVKESGILRRGSPIDATVTLFKRN